MQFFVKGIPTKRRPRFTKAGKAYVDVKTKEEEKVIRSKYRGKKHRGPVYIRVDIYPKLPKSAAKGLERVPAMKRPDVDNVLKVFQDALIGVAFDDDKQVVHAEVIRHDMTRIEWDYCVCTVKGIERE
ncbi:MAG: RusA family crossover junction endodeoxyribonuclease [Eggerthellaceae bacterium]|nr:RusA family crossover junction endodeoxyribonuclease [Eggerthellaceae bacterium]